MNDKERELKGAKGDKEGRAEKRGKGRIIRMGE